jgi:hypothetical protein
MTRQDNYANLLISATKDVVRLKAHALKGARKHKLNKEVEKLAKSIWEELKK